METVHRETLEEAATHATDEARMVLPGVQAIMGFQLVAVFNQRFELLEESDQAIHMVAFFLISLAMGLLMTPAAYHRLAEKGSVTRRFVVLASWLISAAFVPLLIGLALDSYILVRLVSPSQGVAVAAAGGIAIVLCALWFVLPLGLRRPARATDPAQRR